MRKQIPILRGLAILGVACCHCAQWGHTAMFFWAHRFRQVESPNFDQVGSVPYYLLLTMERLPWFSVPAFLFIAGFSIAYAAGSSPSFAVSWKTVRVRVNMLLWPFLIWSAAVFLGDRFFLDISYSPREYFSRLILGRAEPPYFFVPLLMQFLILSPFITRWAKKKPAPLLLGTAALHGTMLYFLHAPGFRFSSMTYPAFFVHWSFYFVLGAVSFLHYQRAKLLLSRLKWALLIATVMLAAIQLDALFSAEFPLDPARFGAFTFSSTLYSLTFILAFLSFDKVRIPFANALQRLGARSYGVYLLHFTVITVTAKCLYRFAPWILGRQILFQPLLLLAAIALPLVFMELVARSPLRKCHRYLFGMAPRAPSGRRPAMAKRKNVVIRGEPARPGTPSIPVEATGREAGDR